MSSIENIRKLRDKYRSDLSKKSNVNGLGVGYKIINGKMTDEIVIRVYVERKLDNLPKNDQIPSEIEGVKTDVIIRSSYSNVQSFGVDTASFPTITGGINAGPAFVFADGIHHGTLGMIVRDIQTNKPLILSSYHVFELGRLFQRGLEISQPSGSNRIIASVFRSSISSTIEASVALLHNQVSFSPEIRNMGPVQGMVPDFELDAMFRSHGRVRKFGIASGMTFGIMEGIDEDFGTKFSFESSPRSFFHQIQIRSADPTKPFSLPGDSGSCIIDDFGRAVGLLVGAGDDGKSYASRIQEVRNELQISF